LHNCPQSGHSDFIIYPQSDFYLDYLQWHNPFLFLGSIELQPETTGFHNSPIKADRHHQLTPEPCSHSSEPSQALASQTQAAASFQTPGPQYPLVFNDHPLSLDENTTAFDFDYYAVSSQHGPTTTNDFQPLVYEDLFPLGCQYLTGLPALPELLESVSWPLSVTGSVPPLPSLIDDNISPSSHTSMGTAVYTASSEGRGASSPLDFATSWNSPLYVWWSRQKSSSS
jgi:hypothetical protein